MYIGSSETCKISIHTVQYILYMTQQYYIMLKQVSTGDCCSVYLCCVVENKTGRTVCVCGLKDCSYSEINRRHPCNKIQIHCTNISTRRNDVGYVHTWSYRSVVYTWIDRQVLVPFTESKTSSLSPSLNNKRCNPSLSLQIRNTIILCTICIYSMYFNMILYVVQYTI